MDVCAISDLHGYLPEIRPCDLLLIAGDICPMTSHEPSVQANWLMDNFTPWLNAIPAKNIVGIAGNHDFVFEARMAPELPWRYLEDSETTVDGFVIWGSPWVPDLPEWAFHGTESRLERSFSMIPDDIDILMFHGPPYGVGDAIPWSRGVEHAGSPEAQAAIARIRPQITVCGHIHEAYGRYEDLINVSLMNSSYEPVNKPIYFHLKGNE